MLWRLIWFRYAAFGVAWAVGKARHRLGSGWFLPALGLAAIGGVWAALWLVKSGLPAATLLTWTFAATLLTWTFFVKVVVVYALLWLIVHAYRSSGRFVVLSTVNHAGKDFDSFAAGLATHLANDLGRLSELYKTIDDANPPTQDHAEYASLKVGVDNPGDAFANVVGEKSNVKLGPVSVSLRPLVAAFERSIPKQRLSSSLHRIGNRLTLLADIAGAEGNWRVERDLPSQPSAENTASALREMTEELVYRVFRTKVPTGSKEWEAVKRFSEGLRAYRRTQTTDMNREINLREAEHHFFAARVLDKSFARCSYNLGTVYSGRKNIEKAIAAFTQAIEDKPEHPDAAYALSVIYFEAGRLQLALEFAARAIAHAPRDMRAWNMKGHVWQLLQTEEIEKTEQKEQTEEAEQETDVEENEQKTQKEETEQEKQINRIREAAWRSSLKFREMAAAFAWRDLCRAGWQGEQLDVPRKAIALPFTNLAVAHHNLHNRNRAVWLLRQAIRQRGDASLYFVLGKILRYQKAPNRANLLRALKAYQGAVQFARPRADRALYHVYIAETSTVVAMLETEQNFRFLTARDAALEACDKALASPSILDEDLLSRLRYVPDVHRRRVVERIGKAVKVIKEMPGETGLQRLERLKQAEQHATCQLPEAPEVIAIIAWTRAIFAIEIGYRLICESSDPENYQEAERFLRDAVSRLDEHYPAEERLGLANEWLTEALWRQSKYLEALVVAEKAVALNPFSAGAGQQLGLVQLFLTDYDQAEQQLRRSFALEPSVALTLRYIGFISWNRGAVLTNPGDRRSEFRKVIETFGQAMDLAPDSDHGWLHFWLGRFHGELMDYDSSTTHYAMARALGSFSIECCLYLGEISIEQELFDQAEGHLRDALNEIFKLRRAERQDARPTRPAARQKARPMKQTARRDAGVKSPKDWWQTPRNFSEGYGVAPGYFLLKVCLLMALVVAERGGDIGRAKRLLRCIDRRRHFLGEPPPRTADPDERRRFEDRRREIAARHEEYLGWVCHLGKLPRQARERLEASAKIRADAESLYHLARVYLDQGLMDRARDCCARATAVDIRGLFSPRLAKIKAEASRSQ